MAPPDAAGPLLGPDAVERREAELGAGLAGLQAGSDLDARKQDVLAAKLNAQREAAALEAQRLHRAAAQVRWRRPSCRQAAVACAPRSRLLSL